VKGVAAIHRQDGSSFVEVLIALAITGSAIVMFLSSLSTGSRAVGILYDQSMAENVARSQLEYTKSQEYVPIAPGKQSHQSYALVVSLPPGFTVSAEATETAQGDDNIQKITVTVYHDGKGVMVKEDFKVNR